MFSSSENKPPKYAWLPRLLAQSVFPNREAPYNTRDFLLGPSMNINLGALEGTRHARGLGSFPQGCPVRMPLPDG